MSLGQAWGRPRRGDLGIRWGTGSNNRTGNLAQGDGLEIIVEGRRGGGLVTSGPGARGSQNPVKNSALGANWK